MRDPLDPLHRYQAGYKVSPFLHAKTQRLIAPFQWFVMMKDEWKSLFSRFKPSLRDKE